MAFFLFCALPALSQVNTGELRLKVTDPTGLDLKTSAQVVSDGNHYNNTFTTDDSGYANLTPLPDGIYLVKVEAKGFAPVNKVVEIASAISSYLSAPATRVVDSDAAARDMVGTFWSAVRTRRVFAAG
jgi:hypothetical protein